jgi:hypothetical protein
MSSTHDVPQFARGETAGVILTDATTGDFTHPWLGAEKYFEDKNLSATGPVKPLLSKTLVKCRCCVNRTGVAIPPGTLVVLGQMAVKNGAGGTAVGGESGLYTITEIARMGVAGASGPVAAVLVDEYLPAAGVPDNGMCWVVVEGNCTVKSGLTQLTADLAIGDPLVCMTGATSAATSTGTTSGGKIDRLDLSITTGVALAARAQAIIGYALSACTSQGYNQSVRARLIPKW